ncbi:Cytochrome P450, family 71, subfamily A, polypeptide 26 [Heracleum sosnowskyi]|uniref:Cytochrome P450, family 71, subfamily A, polypeptide 26 n=1 Tax=Heracleum sosnowskyi TaxID=360622 RepID=A0AAD8MA34_9APIA|nr:Cytochrome P450, family 71, subfamily A, polypeptide 26 [Heracleum sosnowskyi]
MTIILFLAFFFLLLFTVFCYRLSTKKENHKQLPSPTKFPIIGNFHQVSQDRHISLRLLAQRHGPMMLIHLGSTPVVVVSSVAAAREIMKTQDLAFSDRPLSSISCRFFYNYKDVAFSPYSE